MSRVTEALRRSQKPATGNGIQSKEGVDDHQAPAAWDFDTASVPPPYPANARPRVEPPFDQSAAADPIFAAIPPVSSAIPSTPDELVQLARRLFQGERGRRLRSVMFIGSDAQVKAMPVCVGTADVLTRQMTTSACVVDANFDSPTLAAAFGLTTSDGPGLSDAIVDETDLSTALVKVRENFWLLPAGMRLAEAQARLGPEQLRSRLTQLLAKFDSVLVVVPPAGRLDSLTLGTAVDGVVLVLEASATRRESARRAAGELQAAGVRVLGAVLTNRTFPIPTSIYRRL